MNIKQLCGKVSDHIDFNFNMHKDVVAPFLKLKERAANSNIEIAVASGFRDYNRQLLIWNEKALGIRIVLDENSRPLDRQDWSDLEWAKKILRWTALPGLSRHHFGTDLDIYDLQAIPTNYKIQLITSEYEPGGVFEKLGLWLDQELEQSDFYRPYFQLGKTPYTGREPWHISYRPLADKCNKLCDFDFFKLQISNPELELGSTLLEHAEEIYLMKFI